MAKRRKTHHAGRSSQRPDVVSTLLQELLDHIISALSPSERLAVFRSCKALRNAVLKCAPVATADQQQQLQLRTRLYLAAAKHAIKTARHSCVKAPSYYQGTSRTAARNLLQLAAHSKHDIHLHIRPAPDLTDSSIQPWLSAVLHPWRVSPPSTPSLQHVTSISLQYATIGHPLPDCIGRACPGLKAYSLREVSWPSPSKNTAAATQPWPQLAKITMYNYTNGMPQLPSFFNASTLPSLAALVYNGYEDSELYACIHSFSKQLTSLEVDIPWSTGATSNKLFTAPQCTGRFAQLSEVDLPSAVYNDQEFMGLLRAAPSLQRLCLGALCLEETHAATVCQLKRITFIETIQVEALFDLVKLPTMPNLQRLEVNIPYSINVEDLHLGDIQLQGAHAWLKHLWVSPKAFRLSLKDISAAWDEEEDEEHELATKLQALSTVLAKAQITISDAQMDEWVIRALGSACFPSLRFDQCQWKKDIIALMWSLMPATNKIIFEDGLSVLALQALCLSATRPVTVRNFWWHDDDEDDEAEAELELVRRVLAAASNKMVTLQPDK